MCHHYFSSLETDVAASAIEFSDCAVDGLVSGQRASGLEALSTFCTRERHVTSMPSDMDSIVVFAGQNFRAYRAFEALS